MIGVRRAQPSQSYEAVVANAPTGLTGTLGVQVVAPLAVVTAHATSGIIEDPAGSGIYERAMPPIPAGRYALLWDTGTITPATTAAEDLIVSAAAGDGLIVTPGEAFYATAVNLPTGFAGTIGVEVVDNEGVTSIPHTTAGIHEYPIGSGLYWALITAPATLGDYTIAFDNGASLYEPQEFSVVSSIVPPGGGVVGVSAGIPMQPYFEFCGLEVTNMARTSSYLANGLCPTSRYQADPGPLPSVLWRTSGVPVVFSSPATDPAPWYDASVPESGEFLGLICDQMLGMDTTESRPSTATSGYRTGGVLGSAVLTEREIKVHGWLIASTCGGLEYGRRWLADVLGAGPDACADCDLFVRLYAPPDDGSNDAAGAWRLYRVALRSLVVTDPQNCCDLREVNLTLVAGDPVLYTEPEVCLSGAVIAPSQTPGSGPCIPFDEWFCGPAIDPPVCCTISPPAVGAVAAVVEIDAVGEDFGGARITINPSCPLVAGEPALAEVDLGPIPQGSRFVIDAARHMATYVDPSGVSWDGAPYLIPPPGRSVPWLEIGSRDAAACICVEALAPCAGGSATLASVSTRAWAK